MLKELTYGDKAAILDFCARRERENIFLFNALDAENGRDRFFGVTGEDGGLRAVGAHFGTWNSFAANGSEADVRTITDAVVRLGLPIEAVPAFRTYALPIIDQLKTHGIVPRKESDEIVYEMTPADLNAHDTTGVRPATAGDADVCGRYDREEGFDAPATDIEKARASWEKTVVLEIGGAVVAKANLHGVTAHYAQIGGVFTHPDHRGKGYAKRCVTALCERCFAGGTETMLLFTDTDNKPARAVYEKLGFKPVDRWVIAEY